MANGSRHNVDRTELNRQQHHKQSQRAVKRDVTAGLRRAVRHVLHDGSQRVQQLSL